MFMQYFKRQKLSERKFSWFTRFHPNVGKTFAVFASSVLKVLLLLKAFVGKTFVICEKCEAFLSCSFCGLRYIFLPQRFPLYQWHCEYQKLQLCAAINCWTK